MTLASLTSTMLRSKVVSTIRQELGIPMTMVPNFRAEIMMGKWQREIMYL